MTDDTAPAWPEFCKKPVVIQAVQWTGTNVKEVMDFMAWRNAAHDERAGLVIHTLEGNHCATPGDWIIKGVKGEFYPCKPDIFTKTYEAAADQHNHTRAAAAAAWEAAREACVEYIDGSGASFSLADLRALPPPADAMAALDEVVRVAVEKEREACAKIAEWAHMVPPDGGSPTEDERAVAEAAAAAIRARSEGDD